MAAALAAAPDATVGLVVLRVGRLGALGAMIGYASIDEAEAKILTQMQLVLRVGDRVFRIREGEYAAVLANLRSRNHVLLAANRLVRDFQQPLLLASGPVTLNAVAGAAAAPVDATAPEPLYRCADLACLAAEREETRTALYRPEEGAVRIEHAELHEAVAGNQLQVHLQPFVEVASRRIIGAESLARWTSARLGPVRPDQFITFAERTGLIGELTRWSINATLRLCAEVLRSPEAPLVSINLSPRVLIAPGFEQLITGALTFWNVPATSVLLEVTETALMEDPERCVAVMTRLRDRGLRIAIDDFGVGQASLSYLKRLPASKLKIDRTFIMDVVGDDRGARLVHSIIDLAHRLGLQVVAEGVEDEATLLRLAEMGCDLVQGYHTGRPAPAAEVLPLLVQAAPAPAR
uniref:EAL domain-containing protein n=1 Tax=Coralloluteibacterium stylophorae TaxID=1776034 RepID=A0A8J7VWA3_9GAMM